ncbi:GNAT family N-acetyltransferase [Streptomyces sp. 7N604]|uniref:GNAT family N-acetyltransferase n=1 Tax=Streptomyces sp. 7N604 TaxID=3457415 RepID=UPI003FD2AB41
MPTPLSATVPLHALVAGPRGAWRPGRVLTTRTGHATVTRPATVEDHAAVNPLHARCSLASLCARYQNPRRVLSAAEWRHMTHPDRGLSWVTHPEGDPHTVIAVLNLMRTQEERTAELGLLVEDGWQSRGLGTALARHAFEAAPMLGYRTVTVLTGADNVRMLRILKGVGATLPPPSGTIVNATLLVE